MSKNWKKVSEKYVVKTPWLAFRKDGYKIASGSIDYYYIVERPDYVVIVPQTADKKFMLVRQYRHGVQNTILNFPMGFINDREKPKQAALRELIEETGLLAKQIKPIGSFLLAPPFLRTRGYVFLAKDITVKNKVKMPEHKEHIKSVKIVNARQLENLIKKGELADASSVVAYFLTKNSYSKK